MHQEHTNIHAYLFLIKKFFPGIAVDESFDDRRSYNIPKSGFTSISKAFSDLESGKLYIYIYIYINIRSPLLLNNKKKRCTWWGND